MSCSDEIREIIFVVAENVLKREKDRQAVKVALHRAQRAFPDQRLTQLISNALIYAGSNHAHDPYNVEDGELARVLLDYADKNGMKLKE